MDRYTRTEPPKKRLLGRIKEGCRVRIGPLAYTWPDVPNLKDPHLIFEVSGNEVLTLRCDVPGIGPYKTRQLSMIDYLLPTAKDRKDCVACNGKGSIGPYVCMPCFNFIGKRLGGDGG